MNWLECDVIEQVPGRLSGAPVIRHSRVRPEDLISNLDLSEAELAQEFDLPPADVHAVLEFWRRIEGELADHP